MKHFYTIFFCILSIFCVSQNIDSLYKTYRLQTNLKEKTITLLRYADELIQFDIDSTLRCSEICLSNGLSLKDTSIIGQAYILKGYAKEATGNYKEAMLNFVTATNLFKKTKNKERLAQCYTAMGIVYWYQGLTDKAIYYYQKNIVLCSEIKDEKGLAASYGNLAIIFDEKKDFDNALLYYNKALPIFEKRKNFNQIAACLDNMSTVYKQQKDYSKALNYNIKSYRIRDSILDTLGMCASMENLGSIFNCLKKYDDAITISKRVIEIAQRLGSKEDLKFSYINLKEAYEGKKDYYSANLIINQLMEVKDSLRDLDNANQIAELETKFKTKEKDIEISEIKLIQQLKEKENQEMIKRRNYLIIVLAIIGSLILLIAFLIFRGYKEKQKIADAINKKNEAIESQKILIDTAYQELSSKNKDITDSIKYAQKIQLAVLPSDKFITTELAKTNTKHFILFQPKDIVSGDFYWFYKNDTSLFYVTADSTGHGVPGGFMSMLGINLLNEIVIDKGITDTGEILNKLRLEIIRSLKTDEGYSKDGMDAVVCKINTENNVLEYSTANNPIYIIREKQLTVLEAQKMPVGYSDNILPFNTNHFQLQSNDCIYTITDGYADQFGGINGKKFKYKQLKELLATISHQTMPQQKQILETTFDNWKGNLEQVDDVCIIGLRV